MILTLLAAAPSQPLAARATWQVTYVDSMCVVSRQFGAARSPALMAIKTTPLSHSVEIDLQTEGDGREEEGGVAHLSFAPTGGDVDVPFWSVIHPTDHARLTRFLVGPADKVAPLATSKELTLKSGRTVNVTLALDGIAIAMRSLDQCSRDAAIHWGATAAVLDAVETAAQPLENPASWYPSSSYPKDALHARIDGPTTMMWTIHPSGRVVACKVVGESGSAALDTASCGAVLDQVKFRPARDRNGEPTTSFVSLRVYWHLPFGRRLPVAKPNVNSPFGGLALP